MDLTSQAIDAALENNWEAAVEINTKILKGDCNNVDCLNRMGKAYLELGDCKKAATIFRKVLKIDKYNPIALKNLARTTQNSPSATKITVQAQKKIIDFLEEPGKTKLVALVNLATAKLLLKQKQTDQVSLILKRHTVIVTDSEENYLGSLPDDLGHRLSFLIKGGNKYCTLIKSVTANSLIVFIKEISRAKKFADTPSFTSNTADYFSFLREDVAPEPNKVDAEAESEDEETPTSTLHDDEEAE